LTAQHEHADTAPAADPATRRQAIAALIASLTLGGVGLGMIGPLIAVILEKRGYSATVIGLNGAMPAIALLALVFFLPRLVRAIGATAALFLGLFLWGAASLLMPIFSGAGPWLVLRCVLSLGFGTHWVVGESWVNAAAHDHDRGRVIGAYVMLVTLGGAAGPAILAATGFEGWLPFAVLAAIIALAAVPLGWMPKVAIPEVPRATESLARAGQSAPITMAMGLLAGFCDIAVFALFPVYGAKIGLSTGGTMALLVAFLVGTATTQLPLGWLAERLDRRLLAALCAAIVVASAGIMPALSGSLPLLLLVMFLWGGAEIGFYTLGLIELGRRFKRRELIGANTVFALMYGLGAFAGPLSAGAVMDWLGADGLPITVAGAALILLLMAAVGWRRGGGKDPDPANSGL
jgi:MFS family permease